jgi:hypothetical protein
MKHQGFGSSLLLAQGISGRFNSSAFKTASLGKKMSFKILNTLNMMNGSKSRDARMNHLSRLHQKWRTITKSHLFQNVGPRLKYHLRSLGMVPVLIVIDAVLDAADTTTDVKMACQPALPCT